MEKKKTVEPIVRESGGSAKRVLFIVAAGALCLGLAFLALTMSMTSCSAQVASAIKPDGGARIAVDAEVPAALSAKIRKLAGAAGQAAPGDAFFDAGEIRQSLAARPGIEVLEASQPKPDAIRVVIAAKNLESLAASPGIKESGILAIARGAGWKECSIRLERRNAKAIFALFPAMSPELMDALSPPALEDDPIGIDDYRTMLKSVLGDKAMPAMNAAAIKLSIAAPGAVLASEGGTLSGSTLSANIPLLDLLTLEKPIFLRIRWKSAD